MHTLIRGMVFGIVATFLPLGVNAGQPISYRIGGVDFEGYSASASTSTSASGKSKGLVVIIHDWDGLTDYEIRRAEMLSTMGYDAFAVDLYGKGNRPVETGAKKAETGKLYADRDKMRTLILGGLAEARKSFSGAGVVMGYCFGGAATLELARSGKATNIAGYATFHGGLKTPEDQSYPGDTPPLLIAHGGADTSVTMDHVAALSRSLEEVGIDYEIQVYAGAPHAFTVFDSARYRKAADEKSWAAFRNFLAANLGS